MELSGAYQWSRHRDYGNYLFRPKAHFPRGAHNSVSVKSLAYTGNIAKNFSSKVSQ